MESEPEASTPRPKRKRVRQPTHPEFLVVAEKKFWSPFRIVSLSIAGVLLLLVLVLVRKQQRDYWTTQLRSSDEKIRTALTEQNWIAAREQYEIAARAVDKLGRSDSAAQRMRQGLKETTALTGLCSMSLLEILNDAEQTLQSGGAEEWSRKVDIHYRGQWLALETPLKKLETDDGEEWRIDFPAPVGPLGREVVILANLDAFDVVEPLPAAQPLIFAAQLESCKLSADKQFWEVRLNPHTGFLWSDPATYSGLGFTFNEWRSQADVLATLQEQSRRIGIESASQADPDDKPTGHEQTGDP